MDARQEALMLNGADCPLHFHSQDRVPTHDTLSALQGVAKQTIPTGEDYTATSQDDYILCAGSCTVTLPPARNGQEYEIVKTFAGGVVTILPSGTDTIIGTTSVLVYVQWTALRFKAISGGWAII